MPATDMTSRLTYYVEELLENDYAQDNLREGADKLRAAYERSRKRRVKAARDEKLQRQLGIAATSISEGAKAIASGRRKPPKRRGRWFRRLVGASAIGVGVAFAVNEDLRSSVLGSRSRSGHDTEGGRG
jgi:hypothetical protein